MAQRVYATASDYYEYVGDDDPNEDGNGNPVPEPTTDKKLNARLRSASEDVDSLTRYARFDIDEDGYPTDAEVSDAFKRATCAIVEFWSITDDPTGAESLVGAVSIGSVSLGTTSSRVADGDKTEQRIGAKAASILRTAGLIATVSY